jgi:PAS domain S-box-containing protein
VNDKFQSSKTFQRLREKAEQLAQEKDAEAQAADQNDIMHLVHELEIQNLELELQNKELTMAKRDLERSREEFFDLWNSAPTAYLVLNEKGIIKQYNRASAELLGNIQKHQQGLPFLLWIHGDDVEVYYHFMERIARRADAGPVELRLRVGEHPVWVQMLGVRQRGRQGEIQTRLSLTDISERVQAEQTLRKSEEKFRLIAETSTDIIFLLDPKGSILYCSPALETALGYTPAEVEGRDFGEYVLPSDLPETMERFRGILEGERVATFELGLLAKNGTTVPIEVNVSPLFQNGKVVQIAGISRDITERRRAEQALRDSEERLRLALKAGEMGVWDRIPQTGEASWNRRMYELYGRDPDASAPDTEDYYKYIFIEDLPRVQAALDKALNSMKRFESEFRIIREDGERRWIAAFGVPVQRQHGEPYHITGVNLDITERKQAEAILESSRNELEQMVQERTVELENRNREQQRMNRQMAAEIEKRRKFEKDLKAHGEKLSAEYRQRKILSGKLVSLLEKERRSIGSTLHDNFGQLLTGAALHIEGLIKARNGEDPAIQRQLENIQNLVRDAIKQARNLAHGLRSDSLERFGLVPALEELIAEMKGHFEEGIQLFVKNVPEPWGNNDKHLTIYRVVQEGLTNALKHAKATEVFISLNGKDGFIILAIEDNGVGFDYDQFVEYSSGGQAGIGLIVMRERVFQVEGDFHIESRPGRGTQIIAQIPI